ncbi:hypothetical protein HETIRDRAFT_100250 [Heterobasidion irregulare TC 32-1]|uniref:Uncharacterized protein n=1 Tax=Heterobasidion irregulare (strain TC 32-1) TaxID=747525 RepID=W4KK41_HETIT|nr:uncharacterized protein HETIRDRAFT_100250 [Heterobasidion irregulare TC 32-1]ETW86233.1 hypothetical protein HETIRDRAFT_100250 [Heterobasidion irregulare TC 32-1]
MYHVRFRWAHRVKGNKGLGTYSGEDGVSAPFSSILGQGRVGYMTGGGQTGLGAYLLDANFTIHYGHPDCRLRAARIPGPVLCGPNSYFSPTCSLFLSQTAGY